MNAGRSARFGHCGCRQGANMFKKVLRLFMMLYRMIAERAKAKSEGGLDEALEDIVPFQRKVSLWSTLKFLTCYDRYFY